ncbi:VOC family protein [Marivita sp. S0852]|uniref:VOC family protein n=1 Tax=Marivita sp. S0852 TaxID=3373893 RepID=UPI0039828C3F
MEQRVSLITLGVRDADAVAAFYEKLGWARVETQDGVIAFDLLGQTLGLYPLEKLAEDIGIDMAQLGHGSMTLGYNTRSREEVDAVMAHVSDAGGTVLKDAQEVFWGGYHGYFSDPEGHIWEVAHNPFSPLRHDDNAFRWTGY